MELRHLRYFVAVAEEGSLTVAAEKRLHTTQPSLSRQIRDLEYEVGVTLMTRGAHGVELTAAGEVFLNHARLALAQAEAAAEGARRASQPIKPIFAIGFLTGQEVDWLSTATNLLIDEMLNIEIGVFSGFSTTLADDLQRGKLDIAFLRPEPKPDLEYKLVTREPLVAIMPSDHWLASREAVQPRNLLEFPTWRQFCDLSSMTISRDQRRG
jgi:LysR family hca operon transcriptional activator